MCCELLGADCTGFKVKRSWQASYAPGGGCRLGGGGLRGAALGAALEAALADALTDLGAALRVFMRVILRVMLGAALGAWMAHIADTHWSWTGSLRVHV